MNGFLLLDKDADWSSYDIIRKLKPLLSRKTKIGHAGSLDPFATGLLILMIGKGTKKFDQFQSFKKGYEFSMEFGYETDTQDLTGEVIKKDSDSTPIDRDSMQQAVDSFPSRYLQTAPAYSAKKIAGKAAYKYARKGEAVELPTKEVDIYDLALKEYSFPTARLNATVSSGTYIRTLAKDLAGKLDRSATCIQLRRFSIGQFSVLNAKKISEFSSEQDILDNLVRIEEWESYT